MERIAIIGLGLIGGSLGLAIKRAGPRDIEVAGTARTHATLRRAKAAGAIDVDEPGPAEAARGARMVVLAAPIMTFPEIMQEIAPVLAEGAVVTDVASVKGQVARWARQMLPDGAQFVGGHPMAGKEQSGIDAAEADLFAGKPWVISPSVSASEQAVRSVVGLAQLAGARPMFMDPDEHDSYAAAVSHLPLVLASALFSTAFGSAAWPELAQLASSGFRDTTRLASGSPEMAHDIMATNRENVLHWLDRFSDELASFRETVARGSDEELLDVFRRSALERDNFVINGPPKRDTSAEPAEKISISDMLFGSKIAGAMRKQQETLRQMEERQKDDRR